MNDNSNNMVTNSLDSNYQQVQKLTEEIEKKKKELFSAKTNKKKIILNKELYELKLKKIECEYRINKQNMVSTVFDSPKTENAVGYAVEFTKENAILEASKDLLENLVVYERILRVVKQNDKRANNVKNDILELKIKIPAMEKKAIELKIAGLQALGQYQQKYFQPTAQQSTIQYEGENKNVNNSKPLITKKEMLTNKDIFM